VRGMVIRRHPPFGCAGVDDHVLLRAHVQDFAARFVGEGEAVKLLGVALVRSALDAVWVFSAGSLKGGVCLALYRLPVINGLSMFSSMKVTITSWPMRGRVSMPQPWPAQVWATRTQQESPPSRLPSRSQWKWTLDPA